MQPEFVGAETLEDDDIASLGARFFKKCPGKFTSMADEASRTTSAFVSWKICINRLSPPSQSQWTTSEFTAG